MIINSKPCSQKLYEIPCSQLHGVGSKIAGKLKKMGISTLQDLLFHLPLRYEDRTKITSIGSLRPNQQAAVQGKIDLTEIAYHGRRQLLCRISDGTGFLTLRFFHFSKAQQAYFKRGRLLRCFGEVRFGQVGYEIIHPECQWIDEDECQKVEPYLTAIYSTTEGLHQLSIRKLIHQALNALSSHEQLEELLPESLLTKYHYVNLKETLVFLHRPDPNVSAILLSARQHSYQKRLAFEELLAHHLSLIQLRKNNQAHLAYPLQEAQPLLTRFLSLLGFSLTSAQHRAYQEILNDVSQARPMLRLVQGDVGSGKTVVAAMVGLTAIASGYQVVVMAPTELLADQHFKNFQRWMGALEITTVLLTSSLGVKARRESLESIRSGQAKVIIGTHALFQDDVQFKNIALMIIDEQHRFGVHQRLALRDKGTCQNYIPHQLIMTATPIPRTLAMAAYADLDHSIIDELPPGRIPVKTAVMENQKRSQLIQQINQFCRSGKQVYWVCTLIEESEFLQCQNAEETYQSLQQLLPDLKIGLVHGRMKTKEKETAMQLFKEGKVDLLVATTVIEVGVDIPNATLMVIENAERLGLSQLHQLRGRVGRGSDESHCLLLYQKPLSEIARARLTIMRKSNDGFQIAEKDLALRGPGEVLGTKQSGIVNMRVADLMRDQHLLPEVQKTAQLLLQQHPENIQKIIARWLVSDRDYGRV